MSDLNPIVVLGEALVDQFASGAVAGGAPFNVARSLAALGLAPLFIGRIGAADAGAHLLLDSARRCGLDCRGLQRDALHPTGTVGIEQPQPGAAHRFVIHADAAWDHLEAAPAEALLQGRPAPRLVYFGSLAQRGPVSAAALQRLLARFDPATTLRYLDLNLREGVVDQRRLAEQNLGRADWLKVNEEELCLLLDWFVAPAAGRQEEGVAALMTRFALQRLILTRGERGYAAFDAAGQMLAQGPGEPVAALVDTVGAGDAFSAMLLAAQLRGMALPAALALANRYAAALCAWRGPLPDDADFFTPWRAMLA